MYQFAVRHHLQSDIRDVPGRPGRPFPNAAGSDGGRLTVFLPKREVSGLNGLKGQPAMFENYQEIIEAVSRYCANNYISVFIEYLLILRAVVLSHKLRPKTIS